MHLDIAIMPKCAVCDGEQFYESAGFYYCLVCSTQSQDLLRTEAETDFTAQAAFSTRANALRIAGGGKSGLKASTADQKHTIDGGLFSRNGEPETLFVLVDVILRAQVEWLIENAGARPELRDVTKNVWMSFLCEALPDVRDGVPSCLSANHGWTRILRKSDVCALSNCRWRDLARTLRHFKTGKKPTGSRPDKVPRRWAKSADVDGKWLPVIWTRVAARRLTMNRVIALLMIALHLCGESTILMSDVLRWIRLLQLPCVDPSDFIPDDQLVTYYQLANSHDAFCLKYHEVEWEMSVMLSFLRIPPQEPCRVPVYPVIQRLVEELNLPFTLIPIIMEIAWKLDRGMEKLRVSMRKQKDSAQRSEGIEGFVMSLIILVLRMLFGLDGITEGKIASRTYELQQLVEKVDLFHIGQWISHLKYRRLLLFKHTTIMRDCSTSMRLRSMEKKMLNERRVLKWSRLRQNLYVDENLKDLQYSFQEVKIGKYSKERYVDVPVTNRPFRAHAESLIELYPLLGLDYSKTSLDHVLGGQVPASTMEEDAAARRCLGMIKKAQEHFWDKSPLVGANNIRLATQQKPAMALLPSSVLRSLVTLAADMIEQEPSILLGQLMSLEPSFHTTFLQK